MVQSISRIWQAILRWFGLSGPPTPSIGFLCSVKENEAKDFLTAFKDGLGSTATVVPKYANAKYKRRDISKLVDLAKELMQVDQVQVLVTVGGVVSLQAAVQAATDLGNTTVPILFMVGREFGVTHANISGGINLDIPSYNSERVIALQNPPYNARVGRVGLLVNDNAVWGRDEKNAWNPSWGPVKLVGETESNDKIDLPGAINALAAAADGIVISSDAFFTSKRILLVQRLNAKNMPVCYPFDSYRRPSSGVIARPGKSMRYGVDLLAQYRALGLKAADALEAVIKNPGTIPNVGIATITNTPDHW
jgi:hypothetical protein